jgi:RND family efflux transporter MFP subunit
MRARGAGVLACVAVLAAAASVATASAEEGALDCTIEPREVAKVGSRDEGIIDSIEVERGDRVEKGQVLARLESRVERLTAALARIRAEQDVEVRSRRAQLEHDRAEAERAQSLFEKQALSPREMNAARLQRDIASLELESAQVQQEVAKVELAVAETRLDFRTIRSPLDGIVAEVMMAPGEHIHEQSPLLTVARIDELDVEVFVPLSRYAAIGVGDEAVVVPVEPIGGRYTATVVAVDRVFDAASGTFGVRLRLPNPDVALPAGIRCRVLFAGANAAR